MKSSLFKTLGAVCIALMLVGSIAMSSSNANAAESAAINCPTGTVTIQGCVFDVNGCKFVSTINGRTIAVNLFNYGNVNDGDEISATGRFASDLDCAPCVLNPSSVTVLGTCN